MPGLRLGVGGIVAIALGMVVVVGGLIAGRHGCNRNRARAQVDAQVIAAAIEELASRLPDQQPVNPRTLVSALIQPGPHGEPPPLDPDRLTDGRLLDPWGRSYEYKKTGPRTFMVLSWGQDGMPGGVRDDADVSAAGRLR